MRPETSPDYRADVDGLRAVAVAAVVLYHAGMPRTAGGYTGVDMFFVISGFLITRWLMNRSQMPLKALLREFYTRRGRRILPAFLLVLTITTIFAVWLLQSVHLEIYGQFLASAALMLANVGARFNGNYFGWTASDMPLLHLWSVAVEEQFYLFYPLMFFAISRFAPRRLAACIAAGAIGSFALCLWAAQTHPVANYFYLPTRAWELLIGALVALGVWPRLARRAWREGVAVTALAMIAWSFATYDTTRAYPGYLTLVPCIATALLISVGGDGGSAVTRMLSLRPLVFTGLISYSIYLWHMPVFGLFRYYNIFAPTPLTTAALCAAIYLLSSATWAFVERPLRYRKWLRRDAAFWSAAAAASIALLATGIALKVTHDLPRRLAEAAQAAPGVDVGMRQRAARCMGVDLASLRRGDLCRFGPETNAAGRVVVWGDSHTWALVPVYKALAEDRYLQIFVATFPACSPLVGAAREPRCAQFNRAMVDAVDAIDPQLIVLGAYWGNPKMFLAESEDLTKRGAGSLFSRGLQETLQRIDAPRRQVCVVKSVPKIGYMGEYALAMARWRGIDTDFLALGREQAYSQQQSFDRDVDRLEARGLLKAVDPKTVLCPARICRYLTDAGASIYMDDNHVSIAGANLLHDEVARCFESLPARH